MTNATVVTETDPLDEKVNGVEKRVFLRHLICQEVELLDGSGEVTLHHGACLIASAVDAELIGIQDGIKSTRSFHELYRTLILAKQTEPHYSALKQSIRDRYEALTGILLAWLPSLAEERATGGLDLNDE